ncbi:unnamed protein product [[Candida] boidinii]|nr:unnamed protein product [[Candida] boidinii]
MTRGSGSITGLTNLRPGKPPKQKDGITEENNDSAIADDDEDDEDADADNYDNNDKDGAGDNKVYGDYVADNGAGNQNDAHFDITPGSRMMGPIREGQETTYKSRGDQEQSETPKELIMRKRKPEEVSKGVLMKFVDISVVLKILILYVRQWKRIRFI